MTTSTTTLTFTEEELTVLRNTISRGVTTEMLFDERFEGSTLHRVMEIINSN
jgi:hypothetical protein|tara:strand:+ start:486 stop:641 length:156 start_codon:yes stop_codon:yes gene_type:complete